MKNDIADILFKYTTGEATLEETNDALKEAEAGFNLEPGRNEITPDEMALTTCLLYTSKRNARAQKYASPVLQPDVRCAYRCGDAMPDGTGSVSYTHLSSTAFSSSSVICSGL